MTKFDYSTGNYFKLDDDHDLFKSLQLAGSSFGIVTEFHYRIFYEPEVQPVITLVYIEDKSDLWKIDAAGKGKINASFFYFSKT